MQKKRKKPDPLAGWRPGEQKGVARPPKSGSYGAARAKEKLRGASVPIPTLTATAPPRVLLCPTTLEDWRSREPDVHVGTFRGLVFEIMHLHRGLNGRNPKFLLVGGKYWAGLLDEAGKIRGVKITGVQEFMGLEVVKVEREALEVGE